MSWLRPMRVGFIAGVILLTLTAQGAARIPDKAYVFDLPAEALGDALRAFGQITQQQIIFSEDVVRGKRSRRLFGSFTVREALRRLLGASGLRMRRTSNGVIYIESSRGLDKGGPGGRGRMSRSASVRRARQAAAARRSRSNAIGS